MSSIARCARGVARSRIATVSSPSASQCIRPNMAAWICRISRKSSMPCDLNEFYSQMRKRGREVQDSDGVFTERLAVHPSQYGSMDLQDFKKALDALRSQ